MVYQLAPGMERRREEGGVGWKRGRRWKGEVLKVRCLGAWRVKGRCHRDDGSRDCRTDTFMSCIQQIVL